MKVIRKSIFETNSSSVHCIAVSRDPIDDNMKFPEEVKLVDDVIFGWSPNEEFHDPDSKFTYLMIALRDVIKYSGASNDPFFVQQALEYYTKIIAMLNEHGIKTPGNILTDIKDSHVDHSYFVVEDIIPSLLSYEGRLFRFLFNSDSCVKTGNDNGDEIPSAPQKTHETFYKYN